MDLTSLVLNLLNGLAFSMLLFLLAAGLTVIFGMMDFINLAHGSFYMVGAYIGFSIAAPAGARPFGLGLSFWLALLIAPIVVGLLGYLLELTLLRRVYRRGHLDQVLLTFGLALITADVVRIIWGADIRSIPAPPQLAGAIPMLDAAYPRYRLFVIAAGLAVGALLWWGQQHTRFGAIVRAGVDDKEMVDALGINTGRVFAGVFAGGAALAAFAGVTAGPFLALQPGMDFETLIFSLVVVVVGGLGTLRGSFFAAILVGVADTLGKALRFDLPGIGPVALADYALLLIYAIMAVVLLVRPTGLFGRAN